MKPPSKIDGADVLEYAWSDVPFGVVREHEDGEVVDVIYGLAICQYEGGDRVCRFSCDRNWETSQDMDYRSVEEAKRELPDQYRNAPVVRQVFEFV